MVTYHLENISSSRNPAVPCVSLFDRIISAIALEKEFKQTKKILYTFIGLLVVSMAVIPFSFMFFMHQWKVSGTTYFISTAAGNLVPFFTLWQDFVLSILESLPVMAITLLAINVAFLLFSVWLFLYKKGLLLKYLKHSFT